jgi:hypothetical protein
LNWIAFATSAPENNSLIYPTNAKGRPKAAFTSIWRSIGRLERVELAETLLLFLLAGGLFALIDLWLLRLAVGGRVC